MKYRVTIYFVFSWIFAVSRFNIVDVTINRRWRYWNTSPLQYYDFVNQHELQCTFRSLSLFSDILFRVLQPVPSSLIVYLSVSSSSHRPSFSRYYYQRMYLIMTFCNSFESGQVWGKIILKILTMILFLNLQLKSDSIFNISFLSVLIFSLWKTSVFIKSFFDIFCDELKRLFLYSLDRILSIEVNN